MSNRTAELDLPPRQLELYHALAGKGEVKVETLYALLFGRPGDMPVREMQQHLGSPITRLNRRLKAAKLVVRPGRLKYAYELVKI
jgi:hypothetical protein